MEKGIATGKNGPAVLGVNTGVDQQQLVTTKEEMDRKVAGKEALILPALEEERAKVAEILTALSA